jgi:hypothetical protein
MIEIKVDCSCCGKELSSDIHAWNDGELSNEHVAAQLKKRRWIFEVNGPNLDTYCSKACSDGQPKP